MDKMCPSKLFFPDFSLTFEDFYFSLTNFQNSLTIPWPWKSIKFPWLFKSAGNPVYRKNQKRYINSSMINKSHKLMPTLFFSDSSSCRVFMSLLTTVDACDDFLSSCSVSSDSCARSRFVSRSSPSFSVSRRSLRPHSSALSRCSRSS